MKKTLTLFIFLLIATGCSGPSSINPTKATTIIDWVDFIKFAGKEYNGIDTGVISNPKKVKEEIGRVKFKVANTITDPSYHTKDGDAAFWKKGTKIYAIEGYPNNEVIAVENENEINGYSLYFVRKETNDNNVWHYKNLLKGKVKKIELYSVDNRGKKTLINKIIDVSEIQRLFTILDKGDSQSNFSPNTGNCSFKTFSMVFYTDESIAQIYNLFFDGTHYYWNPSDTSVLPNDINEFVGQK